jgi:hypothetical protein
MAMTAYRQVGGYLSDHNINQWQYLYTEVKLGLRITKILVKLKQ